MSSSPAIRLDSVGRRFGALHAVRGVTFDIAPGERRAILGPNGAGKTTLFNTICGDFPPTEGRIELFGTDISRLLHGEQEFELHRPLKPGDTLLCRSRILDIYEKTGRSGPMGMVLRETVATDKTGEIVGSMRHITVVRL